MARGKGGDTGAEGGDKFNSMRINELRRKIHEKGLDIDGSRETLIATDALHIDADALITYT